MSPRIPFLPLSLARERGTEGVRVLDPRLVVVDASVVLKWQLLDEEHVAQADALLEDCLGQRSLKAIAPHLLAYEVVNGIASAVRRQRLAPAQAREAVNNLFAAGIVLREVSPQRVLEVSLQHGLSAYDASYLALAQAEGYELWTGDRPFYESCRDVSPLLRWIGDYPVTG